MKSKFRTHMRARLGKRTPLISIIQDYAFEPYCVKHKAYYKKNQCYHCFKKSSKNTTYTTSGKIELLSSQMCWYGWPNLLCGMATHEDEEWVFSQWRHLLKHNQISITIDTWFYVPLLPKQRSVLYQSWCCHSN